MEPVQELAVRVVIRVRFKTFDEFYESIHASVQVSD